jgi:hypothetical protein
MPVGRPTGDATTLSDVNGNRMVPKRGHQLPHRRHADALHLIEVVPEQHLGGVAHEYQRAVVAHLNRAIGCQMKSIEAFVGSSVPVATMWTNLIAASYSIALGGPLTRTRRYSGPTPLPSRGVPLAQTTGPADVGA